MEEASGSEANNESSTCTPAKNDSTAPDLTMPLLLDEFKRKYHVAPETEKAHEQFMHALYDAQVASPNCNPLEAPDDEAQRLLSCARMWMEARKTLKARRKPSIKTERGFSGEIESLVVGTLRSIGCVLNKLWWLVVCMVGLTVTCSSECLSALVVCVVVQH